MSLVSFLRRADLTTLAQENILDETVDSAAVAHARLLELIARAVVVSMSRLALLW